MDYREFVEKLMEKITEETGYKTRFFEAAQEWKEDKIMVYTGEYGTHAHVLGVSAKECYLGWSEGKMTLEDIVQGFKESDAVFDKNEIEDKLRDMEYYEKIKSSLFIRPLNYDRNRSELEHGIYKKIGEIALAVYVRILDNGEALTSCKLPSRYLNKWEMDEAAVFEEAMINTARMMPPRVYSIFDMVFHSYYKGKDIYAPGFSMEKSEIGNCLSTTVKTNGAVAVFYPGIAKYMSDLVGGEDLYLVFTSLHEVMVHYAPAVEHEDLERVLEDTLNEATMECDILSRHVYYYSRKEDEIRMLPFSEEE